MTLRDYLAQRIRHEGPLSIAHYMEACLTHPQGGYYTTRNPLGPEGDFITAPEMTQAFGEVLGAWVVDCWQKLGSPTSWILVELGPGHGTLMSDVLRILKKHAPAAYAGCRVHLVEISPLLTMAQRAFLKEHPVTWHTRMADLPHWDVPLILLANEFWDALPIQQFVRQTTGYHERLITLDKADNFVFTTAPTTTPLTGYTQDVVEFCPAMPGWVAHLKTLTTAPCYQLYIDYGAEGTADTFQAIHHHAFADPLAYPGEADLTAHVNFSALKEHFGAAWVYTEQAAFLFRLGFAVRAARLMDAAKTPQEREKIALSCAQLMAPDGMGHLFKVGCFYTPTQPTPAGF